MTTKIAINGFGRIGRLVLRALHERDDLDLEAVAINDLGSIEANAYLLKRDSVHGTFPGKISVTGTTMDIGHGPIAVLAERDPGKLPWGDLGVDIVLECTGLFADGNKASAHLDAGAKKVLISAPAANVDATIVYGVNHDILEAGHRLVSNASCTTNCLAPVVQVLHDAVGITKGFMTTIHSYTGDQRVVDTLHSDLRRARAAAISMIPTSTGAARAIGLVLPDLAGKIDGTAIRVPTPNVSMIDLVFTASRATSVDAINEAISTAAATRLKGVLETTDEPTVSIDFNHNPASSIFDLTQTQVVDGDLVRILSWYDNEWGFSNRMLDTAGVLGALA